MRKVIEYTGIFLVIVIILAAAFVYMAPHFGWRVDAVASGSMEPSLNVGSLVVTLPVGPEEIAVGDIITFKATAGNVPLTHRVIGITRNSPLSFETMGDANLSPDPFIVPESRVIGKTVLHIPNAGYVTEFLKTPPGFFLGLVVPALIVIATYIKSIWQVVSRKKAGEAVNG